MLEDNELDGPTVKQTVEQYLEGTSFGAYLKNYPHLVDGLVKLTEEDGIPPDCILGYALQEYIGQRRV